ncbi:MAG: hypothetical protein QOD81_2797 [Solirubrobacteraceae bacterium]|jgi:hypothetical protein|nr:hypothetical protein [Solirubrobacteraceae bacterium]
MRAHDLRRVLTGAADRGLDVLLRPRVRRIRRWSFVVTLPAAVLMATVAGVQGGALVIGARMGLWLAVALAAWRLGGERGEAVRDLLMHPRARALLRTEVDVTLALPRLALARLRAAPPPALRYSRGDFGPPMALALTPAVLAEEVAVHLLVPSGWVAVHVVSALLHGYALVWLVGWGLGSRAYPHALRRGVLTVRNGPFHRADLPLHAVTAATARRQRVGGEAGLVLRDGAALLPARGRVDVWLELDGPVMVRRPLSDPVAVHRIALASDDPEALARLVLDARPSPAADTGRVPRALGVLDAGDLLHHALQPS